MTDNNDLSRRQILERVTLVMGGALSLSLISACDSGVKVPDNVENLELKALNQSQFNLVGDIAGTIIPDTETPGAKSVHVDYLIDELAANWMTADERADFLDDLTELDARIEQEYGKKFSALNLEERGAVLDQLGAEMLGDGQATDGLGDITNSDDGRSRKHIYRTLRELTLFGYYTSEVGASEELIYDAIPGAYKGCVPFEDIGKAWSI